jgi:hypothetical protein
MSCIVLKWRHNLRGSFEYFEDDYYNQCCEGFTDTELRDSFDSDITSIHSWDSNYEETVDSSSEEETFEPLLTYSQLGSESE